MAEVKFSIKMDEDKKSLMESLGKDNYRTLAGEINFAVDFYLKHLRETGATFIQVASSSTQLEHSKPSSTLETLGEPTSTQRHPVAPTGTQQNQKAPTGTKLNINSFHEEIDDL